ncbi:FmdB family zinc ribbon protein [Desulfospira joergensenii]|uniref:FmdB family zinc ribbon protein n=1 Tax=Desulfospira joergensenii TaxID=53329 RepID=UPI0003B4A18B|nr:zinc ribbon domain-containing protein [Desulfospira joergensenii]
MPVYEYQCTECGEIQEAFQKISDPPIETCSKCRGHLKKLISQSSFHLKGSGWYVTDYGGAKTGSGKGPEPKETSTSKSADTASKKVESSK